VTLYKTCGNIKELVIQLDTKLYFHEHVDYIFSPNP